MTNVTEACTAHIPRSALQECCLSHLTKTRKNPSIKIYRNKCAACKALHVNLFLFLGKRKAGDRTSREERHTLSYAFPQTFLSVSALVVHAQYNIYIKTKFHRADTNHPAKSRTNPFTKAD